MLRAGSGASARPMAGALLPPGSPEEALPGSSGTARVCRPLVSQLRVLSLRMPSSGPPDWALSVMSSLMKLLWRGPSDASERPLRRKSISPGLGVLAPCRLPLPMLVACSKPSDREVRLGLGSQLNMTQAKPAHSKW